MPDGSWILKFLEQKWTIWLALLLASGVLLFGEEIGISFIAEINATWRNYAGLGVVLFGSLTLVGVLSTVWGGIKALGGIVAKRRARASYRRAAEASLNDLNENERSILAYLVTRGERHFTSDINGGGAASLIGRGLIHLAARPGQSISLLKTPYSIDDDVWEALQKRKDDFVHPNPNGYPPYSEGW